MGEHAGRRCGAVEQADGSILWRVWAPRAKKVQLVLMDGERQQSHFMHRESDSGYFRHSQRDVSDGQLYAYRLDDGEPRQDPCSLFQPQGVPGPSVVVRTSGFDWTDERWRGIERQRLVIYELHTGTFTSEGTFEAIIPRLAELRELGITALEIMPINQFPGTRNWGYDGVLSYAVQNSYGGPRRFASLIDACHSHDMAVILDVVYNHFGPESNFLHEFGPYFTDAYKTPWGAAVNFDGRGCDAVRDFVLDNVRMWLEEYHLDGLRLDAVHAIYDLGARHILRAISEVADDVAARSGRQVHIIAESDQNDPRMVLPVERGGHGLSAQWSDDFHHAVHALLSGERRGYYADFGEPAHVARSVRSPFVYAWDYSPHRERKHGAPLPDDISGDRFVVCIQNHDQVGNRAVGDRLSTLLDSPAKLRLAASLMLLSPYVPLLFMGEEYGEENPFPFFCSFDSGQLIEAVRQGRRREFEAFVSDASVIPDPNAVETFASARLSWNWSDSPSQSGLRRLYGDLLAARRTWPAMIDYHNRRARLLPDEHDPQVLELIRGGNEPLPGQTIRACFNLSDAEQPLRHDQAADGDSVVLFSSELTRYYGRRSGLQQVAALFPNECIVIGPSSFRCFD